ncbi:M14 family metallopeptidase [Coraliomargarita parva]|uniref:M14 family metallopeptidase n=1 Tax=Coraliomargarita parva TaxID=3014050 RepID=UPI0022B2B98E|nr:M14 family metallocarboxypeptidase [Coraliomargarita parva]
MIKRVNADQLLRQLESAAKAAGFQVETYGRIGSWPLQAYTREGDATGRQVYLSAGIHGDEPAGPLALLDLLEAKQLPNQHHYAICPLMNPAGYEADTRENHEGIDLNRDYRDFRSEEIRSHCRWATTRLDSLDTCLHLHEDWESKGFYLYELNFGKQPGYANTILQSTLAYLPTETAAEIDGRAAANGLICPERLPQLEEGHPEAIYFQQKFGGLNYTLETPSSFPLELRIAALKAAVLAVL